MTRIAVSIETLTDEVHARSPQTTIYHYDNDTARNSDHDPNSYGVICACDIMQGHGLDLHKLSREIVASRHPECAYVIYNNQIASRNTGWEWVGYDGDSDHSDHIHVSVGVGADGYKRPPYDSTRTWLGADMDYSEAQMRAFTWQYNGRGIGENNGTSIQKSTLTYFDEVLKTVRLIATKVEIDPAELDAIKAAAEAGAAAALADSVDDIVAGVIAGLDPDNITTADVEQAVRNVLINGVAPNS